MAVESFTLTANTSAQTAYNEMYVIRAADLTETTVDTAQTIALRTVKLGTAVEACGMYLVTTFKDASDAAFNTTTLTVGETDVDRFLTSTELNVNGTEVLSKSTANAVDTLPYDFVAADTIDAVFTPMSGKALNDIDTGTLIIFLRITEKADLARGIT